MEQHSSNVEQKENNNDSFLKQLSKATNTSLSNDKKEVEQDTESNEKSFLNKVANEFINKYGVYKINNEIWSIKKGNWNTKQLKEEIEIDTGYTEKKKSKLYDVILNLIPEKTLNMGISFNNINFSDTLEKTKEKKYFELNWDYKETHYNDLNNDVKTFLNTTMFNQFSGDIESLEKALLPLSDVFYISKLVSRKRMVGYTSVAGVGKSQFINLLTKAIPSHYVKEFGSDFAFSQLSGFETEQIHLKLINYMDDFGSTIYLNEFKSIITKEKLDAKAKNKRGGVSIHNTGTFIFTANKKPITNEPKPEYWSRIFYQELEPQRKDLCIKEKENLNKATSVKNSQQFINYLITLRREKGEVLEQVHNDFYNHNTEHNSDIVNSVTMWLDYISATTQNINGFTKDYYLNCDNNIKEPRNNPYHNYSVYCKNNNQIKLSVMKFIQEMKELGYNHDKKTIRINGKPTKIVSYTLVEKGVNND